MGKIIELDMHIANQIAAGEVVERPASVVKELIENSLDAKASNIEVRIKDGGFTYLVVQDDGCGMDEGDVLLSCKRYATSKLKTVHDLESMSTFGFRGEALPSIASISRLSIISRPADAAHAHKVMLDAGTIQEVGKAGASFGTRIEVRDLFFNVPARLKFAKSRRTESAEIHRLLSAYAFLYPRITWKLFIDDRQVLNFHASEDALKRASALLGSDTSGLLYPIDKKTDFLRLSGIVSAPLVLRRDSRSIVIFVNDRLVSDKKLTMAVKTAFRTLLQVGNNPVAAIKIDIDPKDVDVNVHPRKAEVRFREERRVVGHIITIIGEFLAQTPWLRQDAVATFVPYAFNQEQSLMPSQTMARPLALGFSQTYAPASYYQPSEPKLLAAKKFSDLKAIGQLCKTYLLTEGPEGLVVVDQHAAHERIMFEKILKLKFEHDQLLLPVQVKLDFAQMAEFEEHAQEFLSLGLEIEKFSEDSLVVRSVPRFLSGVNLESLVLDLISDLSTHGRSESALKLHEQVCATMACHSSIRAGQKMSLEEIQALLIELDNIDFAAHCPHGRPLVKSFSAYELKKWFDRT